MSVDAILLLEDRSVSPRTARDVLRRARLQDLSHQLSTMPPAARASDDAYSSPDRA